MTQEATAEIEPVENVQPLNEQPEETTETEQPLEEEQAEQPEEQVEEAEAEEAAEEEAEESGGEEESGSTEAGDSDFTPEEKAQYSKKVQKTINRLTYNYKSEVEAHNETRAELEKAQAQLQQLTGKTNDGQAAPPKLEDFDSYEEYNNAMVDYKVDQRLEALQPQAQDDAGQGQAVETPEAKAQRENWQVREQAIIKQNPNYAQDVQTFVDAIDSGNPQASQRLGEFVVESQYGPEVLNHIATNPEVQIELMGASATQATLLVSEIEKQFVNAPKTTKKAVPKNKPPTPVKASRATVQSDSQLSGRELRKKHGLLK